MHEETGRLDIKWLADVFTDLDPTVAALGAGARLRFVAMLDARQVLGQRLTTGPRAGCRGRRRRCGRIGQALGHLSLSRRQITGQGFLKQVALIRGQRFTACAKTHPAQVSQFQGKCLDFGLGGVQLGVAKGDFLGPPRGFGHARGVTLPLLVEPSLKRARDPVRECGIRGEAGPFSVELHAVIISQDVAESTVNRALPAYSIDSFMALLHLPVGRRCGVQSWPIDPGNPPLPLRRREGEHRGICRGPGEVALRQAALTEPDAGAIPDQELEPILASVAEGVGASIAGRAAQGVLDLLRQAIHSRAHVDRFDDQPDLRGVGVMAVASGRRSARKYYRLEVRFSRPGTVKRYCPVRPGAVTLSGISVSNALPACAASFALLRQRLNDLMCSPWLVQ